MKPNINEIWCDLERINFSSSPFIMRAHANVAFPGFFIALSFPENRRSIAFHFEKQVVPELNNWNELRDISFFEYPDLTNSNKCYILIQLLDSYYNDVFNVLCEDLILSISQISDEKLIIKELYNRIEKWKSLFENAGSQGLSPESQRGLFGELYFLRKLLSGNDLLNVVNLWMGPENQIHDFQNGDCSVEVKTTHGNNHQRIQISSERQLDASHIENLFLFHLSLDSRHQDGETLNQMVDSVSMLLDSDSAALNKFNSKLLAAGYFNHHRELYNDTGYLTRQENCYNVEHDFPRIEELDVRQGVGDVKYSIIVSGCQNYLISEKLVTETLLNHA